MSATSIGDWVAPSGERLRGKAGMVFARCYTTFPVSFYYMLQRLSITDLLISSYLFTVYVTVWWHSSLQSVQHCLHSTASWFARLLRYTRLDSSIIYSWSMLDMIVNGNCLNCSFSLLVHRCATTYSLTYDRISATRQFRWQLKKNIFYLGVNWPWHVVTICLFPP